MTAPSPPQPPAPPSGRPPWWPEGEAWPPRRGGSSASGRFVRRLGCLLGLLFIIFPAAGFVISWFVPGGRDRGPDGSGPPLGFVLIMLVVGAIIITRVLRRTAQPIGEVMAAADRVAAGDYSARVPSRSGDSEVARLIVSFNQMTARLEAQETQRRNLLADVTHELRTPLAVIRGTLEGMADGVYARDDAHLAPVLEGAELMSRLLDDLRTLSTAEAGALRLHPELTDLVALARDAAEAFAPRATAKGVSLSVEGWAPELLVDPVRIREVLGNLLSNSLRHTPAGGRVHVSISGGESAVTVAVSDTGEGIPADMLPHIFDRFWRSADSGGSGLGLAIAKSLVEAHGGRIWAESAAGRGTAVRLELPITH